MNLLDRQGRFQAPEPRRTSRRLPVILIVERRILMQSCVLRLLKRELARFHVVGVTSTDELSAILTASARAESAGPIEARLPLIPARLLNPARWKT